MPLRKLDFSRQFRTAIIESFVSARKDAEHAPYFILQHHFKAEGGFKYVNFEQRYLDT